MSESQPPAPAQSAQPPVSNAQAETDKRLAEAQAAEQAKARAAWEADKARAAADEQPNPSNPVQPPAFTEDNRVMLNVPTPAAAHAEDMHATDAERSAAEDHPGFGQPELPPHALAPLADGTGHGPVYNPPLEPTAFHAKEQADAMNNEKLRQEAMARGEVVQGAPTPGSGSDYGDRMLAEAQTAHDKERDAALARGEKWNEADHPVPTKEELVERDRQQRIAVNRTRMPAWAAISLQVRAAPIIDLGDDHVIVSHEMRGPDQALQSETLPVAVDGDVLEQHKVTAEPRELTDEEKKLPQEDQDRLLADSMTGAHWLVQLPDGVQWIVPDHVFRQLFTKF